MQTELETRVTEMQMEAACCAADAERQRMRPFMLLRPKVFPDGNSWCALYGDDLQNGVCSFGDTPDKASIQFDIEWLNQRVGK